MLDWKLEAMIDNDQDAGSDAGYLILHAAEHSPLNTMLHMMLDYWTY